MKFRTTKLDSDARFRLRIMDAYFRTKKEGVDFNIQQSMLPVSGDLQGHTANLIKKTQLILLID